MAERRRAESWAALTTVMVSTALVVVGSWPVPQAIAGDSIWQMILDDKALVGLLRLAVVVVALYGIASVPALVVRGRWATGVGTSGIVAGDAGSEAAAALAEARRKLAVLQMQRLALEHALDELWHLVDDETRPE